jgi:hypothetical protein
MLLAGRCTFEQVQNLGLSCSETDPCPIFLELASVELVGAKLFISGNLHTSSSTLESILLSSNDGGKTWREAYERVPGAILETIQFLDFESGWVAGQSLSGQPRDAFLLVTTDGGATWRKRPIYAEPRVGSIEHFRFDTKTNGVLLLDRFQSSENGMRYELYESQTGGESWTLRQVDSKPIPWKAKPTMSDWRLQPDAASKTFRVERKNGAKWQPIASFSLSAGVCKPAEPALPEAAPAEEDSTAAAPEAGGTFVVGGDPKAKPSPEKGKKPKKN